MVGASYSNDVIETPGIVERLGSKDWGVDEFEDVFGEHAFP